MEWVYIIDNALGSVWQSGKSRIMVDGESRQFYVVGYWENKFSTFAEAAAWCEEQDRQAKQPEIPLPKSGDVWGVPDKRETRRFVIHVARAIRYASDDGVSLALEHEWRTWVRATGAVELIGDREALVAKVKELESKDGYVVAAEWRAAATHWRSEYETAEAARMEAKEVASEAVRQRNELQKFRDAGVSVRATLDDICRAATEAGWAGSGISVCEFLKGLAKERDELRLKRGATVEEYVKRIAKLEVSRDRLIAGLERIRENGGVWSESVASEILAAEEGVTS